MESDGSTLAIVPFLRRTAAVRRGARAQLNGPPAARREPAAAAALELDLRRVTVRPRVLGDDRPIPARCRATPG